MATATECFILDIMIISDYIVLYTFVISSSLKIKLLTYWRRGHVESKTRLCAHEQLP